MAVSSLAIGNNNGYTTNDLSITHKCQTARMPVPDSDVYNAEEGEFMMKTGDRPWFWYSGQWNPMASLYDIPSALQFSAGSVYLDTPLEIPYGTTDKVTSFRTQYEENVTTDPRGIRVNNAGYYHITAQFTLTNMDSYYVDDTSFWISPQEANTGRYLTNSGWGKAVIQHKYLVISCKCVAFLDAGEFVQLLYDFHPGANNGSIYAYGGDISDPANLGLDSFLQVTWAGPANTMMRRRNAEASIPRSVLKPEKVEYDMNYDIGADVEGMEECGDCSAFDGSGELVALPLPDVQPVAEPVPAEDLLPTPSKPFGYSETESVHEDCGPDLSRQESLCSTVLAGDVVEISTFASSERRENVGTSDGTSEWEMA